MYEDGHAEPNIPTPVYLASAAAGRMPAEVVDAMVGHLRLEAELGAAAAAEIAGGVLVEGYAAAARLIGADVDEIAFVESGNRAITSLIQSASLRPGDHVLVDRTCWGGTLDMLASLPDVQVDVMPTDAHGRADPVTARRIAHPRTRLVLLTWAPATCGIVNPAVEVGALAAELGAFYVVDACQVLGQRKVDVRALRCHGLVASGRKWLRGPRGTAVLFASREFLDGTQAFMADQFGRSRRDARRYETGEASLAGRVGLSAAIQVAQDIGPDAISNDLDELAAVIRTRIADLPGLRVVEEGPDLAAFVTVDAIDRDNEAIAVELGRRGITVSNPGRAYAPLDMDARGLSSVLRIAPHLTNEVSDVDRLVVALGDLLG